MKVLPVLEQTISQAEFAELIGVSEARVSQLISEGVITRGDSAAVWLVSYCERLRDMAAGRMGETNGLDLVQERAALAREQRIGQKIKNDVAAGTYAPIELLADVLANASQAMVDRFDQVPATLRRNCPDLPQQAFDAVMRELASARNELVAKTVSLMADILEEGDAPVDDEPEELAAGDTADEG